MSLSKEDKYKTILNNTRFYKNELPTADEFVLVYIKEYQPMGISCFINEYKKEAFMSFKDASSSKKLKNIRKEVTKGNNYILITTKVDHNKGFIDVEKRSIDEKDEKYYTNLINFYQRIFNVFLKSFVFNNLNCSQTDVYNFLASTLWKEDPKNVKDIMLQIHSNPDLIKDTYNLNNSLGKDIFNNLLRLIPSPKCKINITLKINSLSIDAVNDIKECIQDLSNLVGHDFIATSAPTYTCEFIDDYKNIDSYNSSLINDTGKIYQFINNLKKDKLYAKIISMNAELIEI